MNTKSAIVFIQTCHGLSAVAFAFPPTRCIRSQSSSLLHSSELTVECELLLSQYGKTTSTNLSSTVVKRVYTAATR